MATSPNPTRNDFEALLNECLATREQQNLAEEDEAEPSRLRELVS